MSGEGAASATAASSTSSASTAVTIQTVYMIDDSEDEAYITGQFFTRERVEATLQHHYRYQSMDELPADGAAFDPNTSIIVVDLNLLSQRGTDVVRLIRAAPGGHRVIVGICTGSQDPADRRDSLDSGADFCVEKPLNRDALERIAFAEDRLQTAAGPDGHLRLIRTA